MEMEKTLQRISDTFYYLDGKLLNKGTKYRPANKESGWLNHSGYKMVNFEGKQYKAHRIIFAIHHGYFPSLIDHIDRNKTNNVISNLREATKSENAKNTGMKADNTSGVTGVSFDSSRNKWRAYFRAPSGEVILLGRYKRKEDAIESRRKMEVLRDYHETREKGIK
jgi:hypothetical protein